MLRKTCNFWLVLFKPSTLRTYACTPLGNSAKVGRIVSKKFTYKATFQSLEALVAWQLLSHYFSPPAVKSLRKSLKMIRVYKS